MYKITCQQCKKMFLNYLSNKRKFCAQKCYWENKKGKPSHRKGTKFTKEQLERLSKSHLGQKAWNKGLINTGGGNRINHHSGEKNWKWIKDRNELKDDSKDRGGQLHREWSKQVKNRDNWKCRIADENCKGRIEAHHILGWTTYLELRYKINNGITLCHAHHPRKRSEEAELSPFFQQLVAEMK